MLPCHRVVLWIGVGVFGGSAAAALAESGAPPQHYVGYAYGERDGRLRYSEEHWLTSSEGVAQRLVLYRCPDGQPFARKQLRYVGEPWAPAVELQDARDGYRLAITPQAGQWQVSLRPRADAPAKVTEVARRGDAVIDAGFDAYVQQHWNQLLQPDGLRTDFLVPSRAAYVTLRLQPESGGAADAQRFRLRLAGLLGAVAPTVQLTYGKADRRLRQFIGVSDIRDAQGSTQRVRIEFPATAIRPAADAAEVATAERAPLVARCRS